MHQTNILPNIRVYFIIFPVRLAHFLKSIEVGDASRCCSGSGQTNGHNAPPAQRRFDHAMKEVVCFPKRPQLPEAELYCHQNAAFVAMTQVGRWQKFTIFTKREGQVLPRWHFLSTKGFQATSTPTESWSCHLSKTGSVVEFAEYSVGI